MNAWLACVVWNFGGGPRGRAADVRLYVRTYCIIDRYDGMVAWHGMVHYRTVRYP